MGYQLLDEPLTLDEITAKSADNFVEEVVSLPLSTIIDHDLEGFLDILDACVIGDRAILSDIGYTVVGSGLGDEIHIRVTGIAEIF